jgi:UV DNA damage endonuclease
MLKPSVQLGLVCLTSPQCPTVIAYRKPQRAQATPERLKRDYAANVAILRQALVYCRDILHTRLYRMPSGLLPWLDAGLPGSRAAFDSVRHSMAGIGRDFPDMRITSHPDQFVVLSSDRPDVVARSIATLEAEGEVADALGLPRSPWSGINIHGGKADRLDTLKRSLDLLSDAVRSRLTLENDEHCYSVGQLATVGVPVVYDAHHAIVSKRCATDHESLDEDAALARSTWGDVPPLAHLSNGIEGVHDRRHSDLISYVPPSLSEYEWIDVEAKGKEMAIADLRRTLSYFL